MRRLSAPARGDVVWISLDPQAGHEQAGRRAALVLSPALYNRRLGLALFGPIMPQVKGYPFEVEVPAGYEVTGVILADHVKSLDWCARPIDPIGRLPDAVVAEVLARLMTRLDPGRVG